MGAEPELHGDGVDREADPESDAEELVGREMGEARSSEEDAHHGPGSGDAEEDGEGAEGPALRLREIAAAAEDPGGGKRGEEERVIEQDGGTLEPSSYGVDAHGVRGDCDDESEREKGTLECEGAGGSTPEEERQQRYEDERAENVGPGECGVRGKPGIERGELGRSRLAGLSEQCDGAANDSGNGDNDADPEEDSEPTGEGLRRGQYAIVVLD